MDSSFSSKFNWSYDVFISFRGEDTRNNFTSHLHMALHKKGVNVFIDDNLNRGEKISASLLTTIEESRISIIVFSENYASSTWCLDELVKIIECMKFNKQVVFPVFYKVDPSAVRKQTHSYGEALVKHQVKFMVKIQTWREALIAAADLSGWDLGTRKEADLIQNLVEEVLSILIRPPLYVAKHLVEIDSQLQIIELPSHVISDGVNMLGIYGIGGIGKTTLAKALYNKIANQFEGNSFLSNVREASRQFGGLVQLQEKLLFEILKDDLKVGNLDRGINIIRDRLSSKKVLILLDDVDKREQLDALVGGRDWFGQGSRIIVTTRDKHLLSSHGFDKLHGIRGLNHDKALELFSWHAFKRSHPPSDYLYLSRRVVGYCKGLPLALVVLGSFLCTRDQSKWKSVLDQFENSLNKDIQEILQISYDGLEDNVKDIFLDISCFFVGEDVDEVKNMLEACNLNPDFGITVLTDLSLVTIVDAKVQMHDLIQLMGQGIVRAESAEPGKRSRLWMEEDIMDVLIENSGTNAVEAIKLDFPKPTELDHINAQAFKNMKNLRLLIVRNATCSTNIEYLPNNLKWIDWPGFSFPSFPMSYSAKKLVGLNLQRSLIKHLGKGFKNCEGLKHFDLSHSKLLDDIPNIFTAPNLEKLDLRNCTNLRMIHQSVGFLGKLVTLNLEYCSNLEKLPSHLSSEFLEVLNLGCCKRLEEIPDLSAASNLKILFLRGCENLKRIHESVGSLSKLVTFDLTYCYNLEKLPRYLEQKSLEVLDLRSCKKLEAISGFPDTSNLKKLDLRYCTNLRMIHESIGSLGKLVTLNLDHCSNLEKLPSHLSSKFLEVLNLGCCKRLEEIPDLSAAVNLKILFLRHCENLKVIHESVGSLSKLVTFDLTYCDNLEKLPSHFSSKFLEVLDLHDLKKLEEFPSFSASSNLEKLNLSNCTSLRKIHESVGSLGKLVTLNLSYCSNLEKLPGNLMLNSLKDLDLGYCIKLEQFSHNFENMKCLSSMVLDSTPIKELPSSIEYLTALQFLSLCDCRNLATLPSTIHLLKNLEKLDLSGCSRLDMFPYKWEPTSQPTRYSLKIMESSSTSEPPHLLDPIESSLSKLYSLNLQYCNISNVDFLKTLCNISTSLSSLSLSGNKFLSLPACLHKLTSLKILDLSDCKFLEEIPTLPKNIQKMNAGGCNSLVRFPENIADIVSNDQVMMGYDDLIELILMNSEIPKWFSHQNARNSISVNFYYHPSMNMNFVSCVIFKVNGGSDKENAVISSTMRINNKTLDYRKRQFPSSTSEYMFLQSFHPVFYSWKLKKNYRHHFTVSFEVEELYKDIVTIRSCGAHLTGARNLKK